VLLSIVTVPIKFFKLRIEPKWTNPSLEAILVIYYVQEEIEVLLNAPKYENVLDYRVIE
jgi:hypothetical protein